ncbi:hypothetical protein B484DRAFT_414719, partial [Ochromonadaceae sp. CCMP2298]
MGPETGTGTGIGAETGTGAGAGGWAGKRTGAGGARSPVPKKTMVPKSVLYRELLPYLPAYKRVFLLDEDIHLEGFNYTRFERTWDCAFPHPPLIVQPLIFESSQDLDFLNANAWSTKRTVLASGVAYIEQQAPLMDSVFFEWLVKRVLSRTVDAALTGGVDWGANRLWCNAAKMYAGVVLGLE